MTMLANADLFRTVECSCDGCGRVSHIPHYERRWTCYSCGRGNRTTGATARPEEEDPFAEFLEYTTGRRTL